MLFKDSSLAYFATLDSDDGIPGPGRWIYIAGDHRLQNVRMFFGDLQLQYYSASHFPSSSFISHVQFAGLASLSSCPTLVSYRVVLPFCACRKPDLGLINLFSQAIGRVPEPASTASRKLRTVTVRTGRTGRTGQRTGRWDTRCTGLSVVFAPLPSHSISAMALHDPSLNHHNTPVRWLHFLQWPTTANG